METAKRLAEAGEQSEIARAARSALIGLRASLADAVDRCPQDQGREPAVELIAELDEILAAWPVPANPAPAGPASVPDRRLSDLAAAFVRDPAATEYLDEKSLAAAAEPVGDGGAVWRDLHLSLLRLPGPVAAAWRDRLAVLAAPPEAGPPASGWRILPGEREAVLVPAGPAWAMPTEGIRTSAEAPVQDAVLAALDGRADAAELARLSSLVLELTELDENLIVCLESVLFMGSKRLDDKYRQLYRADLLGRLREYARHEPGSASGFESLIEIDEAVNSLTHRPPAATGSWWAQMRQQSRQMVERTAGTLREAGLDVKVLPLGLRYRDVRDLTAGNDVASRSGGKPGDVLACLRLWTKIGNRTIPGRVMYRA
jgi:hypothetical protein